MRTRDDGVAVQAERLADVCKQLLLLDRSPNATVPLDQFVEVTMFLPAVVSAGT